MEVSRSELVKRGAYVDYGRGFGARSQWLWTTFEAALFTNLLAVLVIVSLTRLFKIILRIYARIAASREAKRTAAITLESDARAPDTLSLRSDFAAHPGERRDHSIFYDPDVAHDSNPASVGWHGLLDFVTESRYGAIRLGEDNENSHGQRSKQRLVSLLKVLLSFSFYVAIVVCALLTSFLATDNVALSAVPDCGVYMPKTTNWADQWSNALPYETALQEDSAHLAKRCYNATRSIDGCDLLMSPAIKYEIQHNASCPFTEDSMCYYGAQGAISFSTGEVDARALGINAPRTFTFRRNTACSPLNMSSSYIRELKYSNSFEYTYGSSPQNSGLYRDNTWKTHNTSWRGDDPYFIVHTEMSNGQDSRYWRPIRALSPPAGSSTTIILILSHKMWYDTLRDDPIFPADIEVSGRRGWEKQRLYESSSRHATAMACVDSSEWRDPTSADGWHKMSDIPGDILGGGRRGRGRGKVQPTEDPAVLSGAVLLWFSLQSSHIHGSLSARLASGLDAQSHISPLGITPLAREQWKVEVTKLFETSLATIQINARNIARGVIGRYPGWVKFEPGVDVCTDRFLFRAKGYINVNRSASLAILIPSLLFILLAIPIDSERIWPEYFLDLSPETSSLQSLRTVLVTLATLIGLPFLIAFQFFKWLYGLLPKRSRQQGPHGQPEGDSSLRDEDYDPDHEERE